MEIVLKDRDGNDILSPTLTQWDQGVTIQIRDFYYSTEEWQYAYIHFYNSTKHVIYAQTPNRTGDTLTTEVPNQLLREPYPITAHVYVTNGDVATDPDAHVAARTVFTAMIGVEPRMRPDDFEAVDNAGQASAAQIQQNLHDQIATWENELNEFYGQTPTPEPVSCYYNEQNGKMYTTKSGDTYSGEMTGETGKIYRTADSYIMYFYENGQWVEWSVSGAINYCKSRADACDSAKSSMDSTYATALQTKETALENTLLAGLGNCVVRVSNTIPVAADYADVQSSLSGHTLLQNKPVITFVIGA